MYMRRLTATFCAVTLAAAVLVSQTESARAVTPAGALDPSFGTGGKVTTSFGSHYDQATSIAMQPDGKIVAAGWSQSGDPANGDDFALARYDSDGQLDASFGPGGKVTTSFGPSSEHAQAVAIQTDGRIVAAGWSWNTSGGVVLARYNADGSLDSSFGSGGQVASAFGGCSEGVNSVAVQPDGKIVVAGWTTGGGCTSDFLDWLVARFNTDGSLDTSFGTGGRVTTNFGTYDRAYAVALQSDNKIVVAGACGAAVNCNFNFALARYNADGSLDASFGTGGQLATDFPTTAGAAQALSAAIQSDGKIVAAGEAGEGNFGLARYNTDGSPDASFGDGGTVTTPLGISSTWASGVTVESDGKILAAGAGSGSFALARYGTDGSLDASFGTGGKVTTAFGSYYAEATSIAIQSDGKILLAGWSQLSSGDSDFALARYESGASTPPPTARYVALGDSVSYGHGLANPTTSARPCNDPGQPSCTLPSDQGPSHLAFPSLIANDLGVRMSVRNTGCTLSGDQLAVSGAQATFLNTYALNADGTVNYSKITSHDMDCDKTKQHKAIEPEEVIMDRLLEDPPSFVTLLAGANDIRFGDCFLGELRRFGFGDTAFWAWAATVLQLAEIEPKDCTSGRGYRELQGRLTILGSALQRILVHIHHDAPSAKILLLTYYQPLPRPETVLATTDDICTALGRKGMSQAENSALYQRRLDFWTHGVRINTMLNQTIAQVASQYSWVHLVDLSSLFRGHELCTSEPYVYSLAGNGSKWEFPNWWRIIHPNQSGQRVLADTIEESCRVMACAS